MATPTTTDPVADFCRTWAHAQAIQAMVYGEGGLSWKVVDIAEYPASWGSRRPRRVSAFVAGRKARLSALRPSGERFECGPGTETLATMDIPCKDP